MKSFLDTHALVEIVLGNPRYEAYDDGGVCSPANLVELLAAITRLYNAAAADDVITQMWSKAIPIEMEDVVATAAARAQARKGASHIDCLGYAMAQRRRIPFVTGDKAFKGLPGVLP